MYASQLTDTKIRALYNRFRDGTATDALRRHQCRVALGERCIGDEMPGRLRYPTAEEIDDAKIALTKYVNEFGSWHSWKTNRG